MVEIYKKGQGVVARWLTFGVLTALAVFGCYELKEALAGWIANDAAFGSVTWSFSISVLTFIVVELLIGLLANNRRFVDYLIASETELRKVSWPTRQELKRQTVVVIVTLFLFGVMLFAADILFSLGSKAVYGF